MTIKTILQFIFAYQKCHISIRIQIKTNIFFALDMLMYMCACVYARALIVMIVSHIMFIHTSLCFCYL